jgi:hypothetical protein
MRLVTLTLKNTTEKRLRVIFQRKIIRLEPDKKTEVQIKEKHQQLIINILETNYKDRITIL